MYENRVENVLMDSFSYSKGLRSHVEFDYGTPIECITTIVMY